jgi:acyl-CoA thioesterase FadM
VKRRRYVEATVEAGWIDTLGHVNFLEYQRVADLATDALWLEIGGGVDAAPRHGAQFAIVDLQVRNQRELMLGDRIAIETRVLGYDAKRLAVQHDVLRGEELCCRIAFVAVSFHLSDRRVRSFAPGVLERLAQLHDPLPEATLPGLSIPHPD